MEVIDSALSKIIENKEQDLQIHFVFGSYMFGENPRLKKFIVGGIKKNNIKTVKLTTFYLVRGHLKTKERMELYHNITATRNQTTVNNDLDSFFENLQLGRSQDDRANTYFLSMLTDEELELIEKQDPKCMQFHNPVDKLFPIKSDAIYVSRSYGGRKSLTIKID